MRITRNQLRQIIKETVILSEGLPLAYQQGREDAYNQDAWENHPKNGGDAEPKSNDPLYMNAWNEAIEEMRMEAGDYDDREFGAGSSDLGDANADYNYNGEY
jgi:hypothetical protein